MAQARREDRRPEANEQTGGEGSIWRLRTGDQRVLGALTAAALLLMGWHWARLSHWGHGSVEVRRFEAQRANYRIDINHAHWVQWAQLEGIGPALSRRIVEDREHNGPFASIDALQRISGIGPKTLERIRPHLQCRECERISARRSGPVNTAVTR